MTNRLQENLAKLPAECLTRHPETGAVIAIWRGERGYWNVPQVLEPETFNRVRRISPDQVTAMENGARYGWDVPAADVDAVRGMREAHECFDRFNADVAAGRIRMPEAR